MGDIYQQLGQDDKALERYKRHIRLHPNDVEVLELMAELYQKKKKPYVITFPCAGDLGACCFFVMTSSAPLNLLFSKQPANLP